MAFSDFWRNLYRFSRRGLVRLCFFLVLVILFFLFRIPSHGLIGNYYDNPEWKGQPVFWKCDPQIGLETLEHAIKYSYFREKNISISWNGWIWIEEEDVYHFSTRSDDGSSIIIDDRLVVNNGGFHGVQEMSGEIFLTKGMHRININYFNGAAVYALSVYWINRQETKTSIPSDILFPYKFSRYLAFLPRHPILLYLVYPALWVLLFSVSVGPQVIKIILQNKRVVFIGIILIALCYLFMNLRYVCDSYDKLRTFLLVSYCFFLSVPCLYLIFRTVFPEFIGIFLCIFYLFLALFPYKIFYPANVDLCKIYLDPSTTLIGGWERYWVLVVYGVLSLFITSGWLWYRKKNPFGNTGKKELIICGVFLIALVLQIAPRLDRNSPWMVTLEMHGNPVACDDDIAGVWVKEFFGYCVMGDVRHHTDANGMFKGVDTTYSKWVNNRRGLNAYFYSLVEPFIHPYYAAIIINGFFFYLILMAGYTLAKYFHLDDTVAIIYPILLSANLLYLFETIDTSFYIQKHAFPVLMLVIGYKLRIYSKAVSLTNKFLFCSVLACSALVYTPFLNVTFIFLWGLFHAVGQLKSQRTMVSATLLHTVVYASIPIFSQKSFEVLLRYYHLEGSLENESVRNIILRKLVLIPDFIGHHFDKFIVRLNRDTLQLLFSNPLKNEYLAVLGAFGVICFFMVLPQYVKRADLKGIYAIYSSSLIIPFIASVIAYIPPVVKYAMAYTLPNRSSNYYAIFILAQSVGIYHFSGLLRDWLPPWIRPKYITYFVVLCIFIASLLLRFTIKYYQG